MLNATRDKALPTTITGSYPRPHWFTEELRGRAFKAALGDSRFREQYLDLGANIVRRELKLPEVEIAAANPRWTFAG